jgi:spore coat polysaccharide biosynthesis predicted glycosyltransferase SpsG
VARVSGGRQVACNGGSDFAGFLGQTDSAERGIAAGALEFPLHRGASSAAMTTYADLRILFRAPAGARRGFGRLVRCRSLARALGVRPLVSLRGGAAVEETALALGCDVVRGGPVRLLESLAPDVLVVDDPVTADARRWIAAGRRAGCLVVSVHDPGLGCLDADLVIVGSVRMNARASRGMTLTGPQFAPLDPSLLDEKEPRDPCTVLVALGGGPRLELALEIAEAIVDADPGAAVRLAGGFLTALPEIRERITWAGPARSLRQEMARASAAVVGGDVSLHEARAFGIPAIGVPVVAAQCPTVAEFVARGAARESAGGPLSAMDVAEECVSLLSDAAMRRRLSVAGSHLIDGRGAIPVAAAVTQLAAKTPWR